MAKMDEVKEGVSLVSKLLMASIGTIVITVGGVVGLFLSGEIGAIFFVGSIVIIILAVVFYGLLMKIKLMIRRLGDL